MNDQDVELVRRETAYRGFFRIDRCWLRHRLHDGGWTDVVMREVFERGHAAAVLPYDPDRDEVVLIDQFRIGAFSAGVTPWLTEVVAGIIEPGEDAEGVARREGREEIGCEIGDLVPIAEFLPSPGGSSETVSLFCGRVDASRAGGVHGNTHEFEDILVEAVAVEDALRRLRRGEIRNAISIIALQWLALNRDEIRARWRQEGGTAVP